MSPLPQTKVLTAEGEAVVGEFVGNEVGASVGLEDGGAVITTGALVGKEVGFEVGAELGEGDGGAVGYL